MTLTVEKFKGCLVKILWAHNKILVPHRSLSLLVDKQPQRNDVIILPLSERAFRSLSS